MRRTSRLALLLCLFALFLLLYLFASPACASPILQPEPSPLSILVMIDVSSGNTTALATDQDDVVDDDNDGRDDLADVDDDGGGSALQDDSDDGWLDQAADYVSKLPQITRPLKGRGKFVALLSAALLFVACTGVVVQISRRRRHYARLRSPLP